MKQVLSLLLWWIALLMNGPATAQLSVPPDAPFDPAEAKELLQPGNATIQGLAYTRTKNGLGITGTKTSIAHETVYLLPFTKHLAEWNRQHSKFIKNRKKQYVLSEECLQFHLSTMTDEYGRFEFKHLKPGKYLLQTKYYMTHYYNGVDVGTKQYFMNKVVEIKSAQEVLKVNFDNW